MSAGTTAAGREAAWRSGSPEAVAAAIRATKREIRAGLGDVRAVFAQVEDWLKREVDAVHEAMTRDGSAVPCIDYAAIRDERVPAAVIDLVRRRGCVVVRGVFPRPQAEAWDAEIGDYLTRNRYGARPADPSLDGYFSTLASDRPQIFGIYWSKPQVAARQSEALACTRAFLNRLWRHVSEGRVHFAPDRECTYADRLRRREPGDATLGLSPHMDAGSVERWIDPAYRSVYRHVFSGAWRDYDPFDGAFRAETGEIPSAAVCSMFRTYQGWTALTPQGPGDGTLQLVPIAAGIVYLLLRPLLDDVPEDVLCGAEPKRAFSISATWHPALLPALGPIPHVEPGDTVWWHPDVVHAVEDRHGGRGYSNVIYIGAAPYCAKNAAYLERQKAAFLAGRSAPDFAPEDHEVGFVGRATADDLSDLGRRQMGLQPW
ncbi:MAG: DUF1479 family protein [Rhodospirillaceae bacterium]|nr:DUF1479 family protein [Rhodospirillaceae bacterium]